MLIRKTNIISLLSIVIITLVFTLTTKDKASKPLSQSTPPLSSSVQSIAKPNWWKKPDTVTKSLGKMPKQHTAPVSNKREPLRNFLKMAKNSEWKIIDSKGIASAKYELVFEGKHYELAIIRMNAKVALDEVLSIWQNKVGLQPKSATHSTPLITKKKQQLELIPLIGEQKTILLAMHKAQKTTFFRLLSNQKIDEEITQKFKDLLFEIEIVN